MTSKQHTEMVENYKSETTTKTFSYFCAALFEIKSKKTEKTQEKSYYIHTQFFNILFQFFILFLCCEESSAARASLMIFLSGRSRVVILMLQFLFFHSYSSRSFYDLRNEKLFFFFTTLLVLDIKTHRQKVKQRATKKFQPDV